jgi:V/A-type H+-transporting ATPase subunit D
VNTAKNKTALLELRRDLEVVHGGAEILEEKRNLLLKEILSLLDTVERERSRLDAAVQRSYRALTRALMEGGHEQVAKEASLPVWEGELQVFEKSFIGIPTPQIAYRLRPVRFPLSLGSESLLLEAARRSFAETVERILSLAGVELRAWRLAQELEKTVVRVNALQKHYVPEYEAAIGKVASALEEAEREFLVLVKRFES